MANEPTDKLLRDHAAMFNTKEIMKDQQKSHRDNYNNFLSPEQLAHWMSKGSKEDEVKVARMTQVGRGKNSLWKPDPLRMSKTLDKYIREYRN